MAIRFENLKDKVGSRVLWDDRADMFTPEAAQAIRAKVDERTVLVFPQLNLSSEEQLQLTDLIGTRQALGRAGVIPEGGMGDEIYEITLDAKINPQPEYVLGTFFWHMDGVTVDTPPPFVTLLSARRTSAKGGQTEFASTYAAYEGLPEDEKAELEGLRGVHSVRASLREIADAIPEKVRDAVIGIGLIKEHPLVWTHASGRKSMVIGTTCDHVADMSIPAGRALLRRLQEWAVQPEFTYRHYWQPGDFVIWDNTGAMHRVIPYETSSGRMMHRTTIAGQEAIAA